MPWCLRLITAPWVQDKKSPIAPRAVYKFQAARAAPLPGSVFQLQATQPPDPPRQRPGWPMFLAFRSGGSQAKLTGLIPGESPGRDATVISGTVRVGACYQAPAPPLRLCRSHGGQQAMALARTSTAACLAKDLGLSLLDAPNKSEWHNMTRPEAPANPSTSSPGASRLPA